MGHLSHHPHLLVQTAQSPCPVHHKYSLGSAAEAAAVLTDRQPVDVYMVCYTEIS